MSERGILDRLAFNGARACEKCSSAARDDFQPTWISPESRNTITADCVRGCGFLANLTDDERMLARDQYQREQAVAERLRASPGRGVSAAYPVARIRYLRKWFLIASAWPRVTTAVRAEASACLTACKLPKCSSSLRVVLAPTPGISSNSLERSRI